MDRGFHHRFLNKRQGLGGVLGSLVPTSSTSSAAKQDATTAATPQNTGNPGLGGGVIDGLSSLFGDVSTLILPSLGPSSTTTSSTPLTYSSSSSAGSTTTSVPSVQTATSTPSATSTRTSATPTPTPALTPTSTPSIAETVYPSSDGTRVVYITSTLSTQSATAAPHTSFLHNPSLEGGVFALLGIVVLAIVFIIVTWTLRKRRRDRLERDLAAAVTFDPGATDAYERQEESFEKRRLSGSSSGHSHGYGYGIQPAYAARQEYHGPVGYGRYPVAAYSVPPHPAPYRAPSPTVPQPAQGGANLTRKFSDRKPVPPLLPNPAYDPSNAHVSVPPQFYQQ